LDKITIEYVDIATVLEEALGHTPSPTEIQQFIDYLLTDVGSWLNDNARSFVRKLAEEGQIDKTEGANP